MKRQTTSLALFGIAITAATACGGGSEKTAAISTTTRQAVATTVSAPTLAKDEPQGAAVNAQYWTSQIDVLDRKTKEFADYYAAEFCKKPDVAHLDARMISSGSGLGILSYPYGFWSKSNPAWQDDAVTQTTIAYYIVSNYCPENPG